MHRFIYTTIIAISVVSFSCNKEETATPELSGTWIESNGDVLTFNQGSSTFTFDRGLELVNGQELPKSGSGIYEYQISENNFSVRSTLSSNSEFLPCLVSKSETRLEMTSFYDLTMSRTLVFTLEE